LRHQHGSIGFELSGIQLLGGSEFDHLSVRLKCAPQGRFGKVVRLSRILQRIHGEHVQPVLTPRLL
jgi:hypothetical protein